MAMDIVVPEVGESITEVIVAEWHKKIGQWVELDETVVALDTDKVSVEVPAPKAGFLSEILVAAEGTANVGDVLGRVEAGERPAAPVEGVAAKVEKAAPAAKVAVSTKAAAPAKTATPAKAAAPAKTTKPAKAPTPARVAAPAVMPAAARAAADAGIDPSSVTGSGRGGRVLKEDVHKATAAVAPVAQPTPPPPPAPPTPPPPLAPPLAPPAATDGRGERVVKLSRLRKRVAERLVQAQQTAAILTTFNECDMSAVKALRSQHKAAFQERYGVKLGFSSFFVRAVVDALQVWPQVNASIVGDTIVYRDYCDIGVAIGGGKGLVVPIIRNAEALSFAEIEAQVADFGRRARDGKLKLHELQGGTFTISNGGVYGSLLSTPILNPPQSGILGMHNIVDRPIGVDGEIVLRPMMYLALSYDHRLVDGREAVSFLIHVKERIEAPERLLLGV